MMYIFRNSMIFTGKVNKLKTRTGLSPVIATLVLLAVSITVAVAASYYMSGITQSNASFEKVEILSAYCSNDANFWIVSFQLKNTGPSAASLSHVFINSIPIDAYDTVATLGNWTSDMTVGQLINSGQTVTLNLYMAKNKVGSSLSTGTTLDVQFHSAHGFDYIKMVKLV